MRVGRTGWSFGVFAAAAALSATVLLLTGLAATASEPGGTLAVAGDVVDNSGETIASFELSAEESEEAAGVGGMFFHLTGPGLSACDAHGPGAEPGTTPLTGMECGGTGGVSVVVDDCTAVLETHGIVHADHPHTVYLGPMTVDIVFKFFPKKSSGELSVEIYTPKDVTTIRGTTFAEVEMDTCS